MAAHKADPMRGGGGQGAGSTICSAMAWRLGLLRWESDPGMDSPGAPRAPQPGRPGGAPVAHSPGCRGAVLEFGGGSIAQTRGWLGPSPKGAARVLAGGGRRAQGAPRAASGQVQGRRQGGENTPKSSLLSRLACDLSNGPANKFKAVRSGHAPRKLAGSLSALPPLRAH